MKTNIKTIDKAHFNYQTYSDRLKIQRLRRYLKKANRFFTNQVIVYPEQVINKIDDITISIGLNSLNKVVLHVENEELISTMTYEIGSNFQPIIEETFKEVQDNSIYFLRLFNIYYKLKLNYNLYRRKLEKSYIDFYKTLPEITNNIDIYKITEVDDINGIIFYDEYEYDMSYCYGEQNEDLYKFMVRCRFFILSKKYKRLTKLSRLMELSREEKINIIKNF